MQTTTNNVDAIVLAGGVNNIPLYDGYTPGYKALLSLHNKTAIQYTLEALRATPQVRRICIVGPEADLRPALSNDANSDNYQFAPGGETLMDSIMNGLQHFADSPTVLVTTADLPLITPDSITDFLAKCAKVKTHYKANIFISVVPERCYTGVYEEFTKPFNRFKDIAICHGNIALVDPLLLQNTATTGRMNQIYSARKSPITSALAIGWKVGLSYVLGVHLLHALTLARMARIASRRFGLGIIPVIVEHPEVTIDIDEAADYTFVKAQLEK